MNSISLPDVSVRFDRYEIFANRIDENDVIHEYTGTVLVNTDHRSYVAGKFRLVSVQIQTAIDRDEDLFAVFDATQTLTNIQEALYRSNCCEFAPRVIKMVKSRAAESSPNLLLFDGLLVRPKYRGRCVGLLALRALMDYFRHSDFGVYAMEPFPLQCSQPEIRSKELEEEFKVFDFAKLERSKSKATAKLRDYYARLGFTSVPSTTYMVADPQAPLIPDEALFAPRVVPARRAKSGLTQNISG